MRKCAECRPKSISRHLLPLPANGLPLATIFGSEWKRQADASRSYIQWNIRLIVLWFHSARRGTPSMSFIIFHRMHSLIPYLCDRELVIYSDISPLISVNSRQGKLSWIHTKYRLVFLLPWQCKLQLRKGGILFSLLYWIPLGRLSPCFSIVVLMLCYCKALRHCG